VAGDRLQRILALLTTGNTEEPTAKRLGEVCADVTAMTGAGIMLMSHEVPAGSVCATNDVSALIEDLQFTLGEGPCVDAYTAGRPVLEPDLAEPAVRRWPAFSPLVLNAGARAVFGFPLQVGAVRLGALNLYRDRSGSLSDDQHADALVMADVAAHSVLSMQSHAPPNAVAAELDVAADFHLVVHQASGMVAAQLGVSVAEALIRLRAYVFAHDLTLTTVAQLVVGRRLRFDPTDGEEMPT
jgi:hypothetical protein